jgi:hypothetical protein
MEPYSPNYHEFPSQGAHWLDLSYETVLSYLKLEFQKRELSFGNGWAQDSNSNNSKEMTELQRVAVYLMIVLHFRPAFASRLAGECLSETSDSLFNLLYLHKDQDVRQILKTVLYKMFLILKTELFTSFLLAVPQNEVIQKLLQKIISSLS